MDLEQQPAKQRTVSVGSSTLKKSPFGVYRFAYASEVERARAVSASTLSMIEDYYRV